MCKNLTAIGKAIIYFDYGHPWIYFYILNSVKLLDKEFPSEILDNVTKALKYCWN